MDGVKIIAELIFALVISLPLSYLMADHVLQPWLKSISIDLPLWIVTVSVFVAVSIVFLVREQLAVMAALEKARHHHHHYVSHATKHRGTLRELEGLY